MFIINFDAHMRGTQFKFENGYTVSVQWGPANYCRNYNPSAFPLKDTNYRRGRDAEIAVFNPNDDFVSPELYGFPNEVDDVVAYVTPDEVVDVMALVKSW